MGGQVLFEGQDLRAISGQLQQLAGDANYLQNPFSSLDPRMKIGDAVMEPLLIQLGRSHRQRRERAAPLGACGAESRMNRLSHEFWWSTPTYLYCPCPRS